MFGEFNEGELIFLGDRGLLVVQLFAALALAVLVFTWLDLRDLARRRRILLLSLRALALSLGIALLLEPAIELRHVTRVRNHVAVLVDDSQSQMLPVGREATTRFDRAQELVAEMRPFLETAHEEHIFDVFTVASELRPSSVEAVLDPTFRPGGGETHLLEAIEALTERFGRRELGGIVIVSDGIDNGLLGSRVRRGEPLDEQTLASLLRLGAPIHTFGTAEPGELRDLSVRNVLHDDFAFVRNAVTVDVDIRAVGMGALQLPVTLYREGVPLQSRQLVTSPDVQDYRLQFSFVPELIGKEIYSIEIPVQTGEALAENNRHFFVLKVIRDKIRALQVVGRPSWDERFLRQLLKGNPNVDLISFFILRTPEDVQRTANNEMSLIPFPTDELFREQLGSFDLVIFQNFEFEPYDMRQYLPNVRDYVRNGGGFLMLGGDLSFASGGYAMTEVSDVLPVRLPATRDPRALVDLAPFRPVLTEAGHRHPITRLEFDRLANQRLWESLPEMPGTNVVGEPFEGATVLAAHPALRAGDGPMPILAVREVGEGRSMALTVDGAWRWSFDVVSGGGTSRAYTSFWNSAIRWLIRDPELNLVRVEISQEVYEPGTEATAVIRVFQPDYAPAGGATGTLRVTRRDLARLSADAGNLVLDQSFTTDERGRFELRFPVDSPGAWRVEAMVPQDVGEPLTDDEILLGISRGDELRDIEPRPELLAALAEATGGASQTAPGGAFRALDFEPARVVQINRRRVIDLWNNPWVLVLFAVLLGSDWTLRRRWGRL